MIQSMLDQLIELPQQFGLQTLVVIGILILLEAVLSADNAIALAAMSRDCMTPNWSKSLELGVESCVYPANCLDFDRHLGAEFPLVSIVGGLYLLWLAWKYVRNRGHEEPDREWQPLTPAASVWQVVPTLALTDLAFSLDSITTAIAVAEETWLVLLGGVMGIVALRFLAGLFIRWLETYTYLQDAGYATVVLVGMRLLLKAIHPELLPPEWVTTSIIVLLFVWGFSKKNPETPLSS